MKTYLKIILLFVALLLVGCKKNIEIATDKKFENEIKTIFQKINSKKIDNKTKIKYLVDGIIKLDAAENTEENRELIRKLTVNSFNVNLTKTSKLNDILLTKSLSAKDSSMIGCVYNYKSVYFFNLNKMDSSLVYIIKAEKIYSKIKNERNVAISLLNKGIYQYHLGDLLGSDYSLERALTIFNRQNDYENIYSTLNQLGVNNSESGNLDKSLFYWRKALEISPLIKSKNNFTKENCYNSIGDTYTLQGKYNQAILILSKGLKNKNIETEDPELYCYLLDNLAYSKLLNNELSGLPNLFFKALNIRKKNKLIMALVLNYCHISEYYYIRKEINLAVKYAFIALKEAKKIGYPQDELLALKYLMKYNLKQSSIYSERYIRISDSIKFAERKSRDLSARIQFETDQILEEKDRAVAQKWIILGIATILLLSSLLIFMLYRQRKNKNEWLLLQDQQKTNETVYQLILHHKQKEDSIRQIEKKRIARDLHDSVMNRLTSTRLNLHILSKKTDPQTIQHCLTQIEGLQTIEREIRSIAHDLNQEVFQKSDSFPALVTDLIDSFNQSNPHFISLTWENKELWESIPIAHKINLYRILQEALSNVQKYAQAQHVQVLLGVNNPFVVLQITDDGIGFDRSKKSLGIGLENMQFRATSLQGSCTITSKPGYGTQICVQIPI